MSEWEKLEDVERDLYEYSHLEYPGSSLTVAPPISISQYRARTATSRSPGLFGEQPEAKEIFISGRGKHHPGTIIRPGQPVISTPEEDMDIRKKIREVSGLGYSNEITERVYGQKESFSSDEEDGDVGIPLPDLKLQSAVPKEQRKKTDLSPKHPKKKKGVSWNTLLENEEQCKVEKCVEPLKNQKTENGVNPMKG
ncbi:uncharacterized protein LOC123316806 [Coccinella septempunctata]|uniref:uncharacterized protein LOC123316806 n=1 Tax=Coccinella septempunctata TaxID=41139 RepID=UPI001D06817A|nr:uncharacterized protein LOC123316806 [Coccinella septempunctata]XP_044758973.1 uncharacterized protein LOC123316806 [Coccinella septempunctata]XP_044758975.1 uncharacterized protein LOC123316806 [Coccinella septempunctata]XP_044758976.1 uncharacterized protein LOC123316806 [Coccinella septempunctata]